MAISLVKGQTIDLSKTAQGTASDLSQVTIGLGWDVVKAKTGLFSKPAPECDLDSVAFLLDASGKVANMGDPANLAGSDVVYFNHLRHPSGHVWHTGDNVTGAGDGDDEQIIVKLDALDARYQRIVFMANIYQGRQRGQHFGNVQNAYIRAVDARGNEIARYNISKEGGENMCTLIFGEVYRRDGAWKFRALGDTLASDSFVEVLRGQYA